ncbi:MAG: FAD-dependent oxidoreductase [Chthonomonas sp.]|nr:FAD-dependent oxidoreductase [Chthonomonas sp.]
MEASCDILIVGGGTGGCAAAMAACSLGYRVVMTEETDWVGGQLTSQAVPPDEHQWVETHGCTLRYRQFREAVRKYYRDHFPLTDQARNNKLLNPGNGWVSRLCFSPRVGLAVLTGMLARYRATGQLQIWHQCVPISATVDGDRVTSVRVIDTDTGLETDVTFGFVLDATEIGDLLPMTGTEYRVGAESQAEFGEMDAPEVANPRDIQAFTWCLCVGFDPAGGRAPIEKPQQYDYWKSFEPVMEPRWTGKLFSWTFFDAISNSDKRIKFLGKTGMFSYRRIIDSSIFETFSHDYSMINWVQNDHFDAVIDEPEDRTAVVYENARQQSLSILYWLQTEAERDDGGIGYSELYAAGDPVGTRDGLAMAPYHRESRRIKARFTMTEAHVGKDMRPDGAVEFWDSIGIGSYRMDLHPSASGRNGIDNDAWPYQVPLGSLVPERMTNLLPACKNIGVTHIANGCTRLHPTEWNIGEAAGLLAAYCLGDEITPQGVYEDRNRVVEFQNLCVAQGIEIEWPS